MKSNFRQISRSIFIAIAFSFAFVLVVTIPIRSSGEDRMDKRFLITVSKNNDLCGWVLKSFESRFTEQIHQERYDDDQRFIRWNKVDNVKLWNTTDAVAWARFDVDNDGIQDLVVRKTYTLGPLYVPNDVLISFKTLDLQSFLNRQWDGAELSRLRNMLINLSPTRKPFTPGRHFLKLHPNLSSIPPGSGVSDNFNFLNRGYINPFHWDKKAYLLAFPSTLYKHEARPSSSKTWVIVLKLNPDGQYEDICYIDRESVSYR